MMKKSLEDFCYDEQKYKNYLAKKQVLERNKNFRREWKVWLSSLDLKSEQYQSYSLKKKR
jgi:hypothetical protein